MSLIIAYFIVAFIVGLVCYCMMFKDFNDIKPSAISFIISFLIGIFWPITLTIALCLNAYIHFIEKNEINFDDEQI